MLVCRLKTNQSIWIMNFKTCILPCGYSRSVCKNPLSAGSGPNGCPFKNLKPTPVFRWVSVDDPSVFLKLNKILHEYKFV